MPSLPPNPSLRHLRNQAKRLLRSHASREQGTPERLRRALPEWARLGDEQVFAGKFSLKDAQRTIAREYGFTSWPDLVHSFGSPATSPYLTQLENEVADLIAAHALAKTGTAARLRSALPHLQDLPDSGVLETPLSAADAQQTVAHENGFETWDRLIRSAGARPTAMLSGLRQLPFDSTQMGVLHGLANYWGYETSPATVFGGSGYAFMINVGPDICPSGPFIWRRGRFNRLVQNLGIATTDLGFFTRASTEAERREVDARMRAAIDEGLPCSLCNDEYQLVTGYDRDGFFTVGPYPDHLKRRLTFGSWEEWGSDIYAYFFIHHPRRPAERVDLVRQSLEFAVDLFRQPSAYAKEGYGVGPDAYAVWSAALGEHSSSFGNGWNATVWSECRGYAAAYLTEIGAWFPETATLTGPLARTYREISRNLAAVSDERISLAGKQDLLAESREMEHEAVDGLARLLGRLPRGATRSTRQPQARVVQPSADDAPPLLVEA